MTLGCVSGEQRVSFYQYLRTALSCTPLEYGVAELVFLKEKSDIIWWYIMCWCQTLDRAWVSLLCWNSKAHLVFIT
jgi:hypothetical protein